VYTYTFLHVIKVLFIYLPTDALVSCLKKY